MSINRLDLIIERLEKVIEILEGKKNIEPIIQFNKACPSADDIFIKDREREIFSSLDERR